MLAAAIRASLIEAGEQHVGSSAQHKDPQHGTHDAQHETHEQLQSTRSAQSDRQHMTVQKDPTSSVDLGSSQQVDEQASNRFRQHGQSSFGASHVQSSHGSSSKPPRSSMPNSRSAAAFYNLDQEPDLPADPRQHALPAGPHQHALPAGLHQPDGISPSAGHKQQVKLDAARGLLQNMDLQAGSNGLSGQPNLDQLSGQHAMHQSQSQPSLGKSQDTAHANHFVRHHSSGHRQGEQQGYGGGTLQEGQPRGPQGVREGSTDHQDAGSQRSPRSASQLSGK